MSNDFVHSGAHFGALYENIPIAPAIESDVGQNQEAEEPTAQPFRREYERHQTNWPAKCFYGSHVWPAVVVDVSQGGVGLDRDLPVMKDETIALEMQDIGTYVCRVAWKQGNRCGLQFLKRTDELSDDAIDGLASSIHALDSI